MSIIIQLKKKKDRDFPDGSGVKTPCFHCRGDRIDPWSGNYNPTCFMAQTEKRKRTVRLSFESCLQWPFLLLARYKVTLDLEMVNLSIHRSLRASKFPPSAFGWYFFLNSLKFLATSCSCKQVSEDLISYLINKAQIYFSKFQGVLWICIRAASYRHKDCHL